LDFDAHRRVLGKANALDLRGSTESPRADLIGGLVNPTLSVRDPDERCN
jgi:hypothetical protein